MYEGGAYCRWGDLSLQSHLYIERHPVLPKQLSQLCFHWLRDRKDLRDIWGLTPVYPNYHNLCRSSSLLEQCIILSQTLKITMYLIQVSNLKI